MAMSCSEPIGKADPAEFAAGPVGHLGIEFCLVVARGHGFQVAEQPLPTPASIPHRTHGFVTQRIHDASRGRQKQLAVNEFSYVQTSQTHVAYVRPKRRFS
jgi:hypothetical protein